MRILFVAVAAALAATVPTASASADVDVDRGVPDCLRTHSCVAVDGHGVCVKIDDGEGDGFCITIWP